MERLKLPITEIQNIILFSKSQIPLSKGYTRIVIGQRGPYVEFKVDQIYWNAFEIPIDKYWKIESDQVDYLEYRSYLDNVKLYYQKRTVNYADYKIDMCYISPFELFFYQDNQYVSIIDPLRPK